jgi:uncharacterized protein
MSKAKHASNKTRATKKAMTVDAGPASGRPTGQGNRIRRLIRSLPDSSSALIPLRGEKTDYRKAIELVRQEGYSERAAALLWREHRRGDARATYALATWYHFGCLYKVDQKKAFRLVRQAHKKGIEIATFSLAISYERGWGVKKSTGKAVGLYLRAARKGDKDAIEQVVRCVFWGIGTVPNRKLAFFIEDLAKGNSAGEIKPKKKTVR